jgi:hypothetical protein
MSKRGDKHALSRPTHASIPTYFSLRRTELNLFASIVG